MGPVLDHFVRTLPASEVRSTTKEHTLTPEQEAQLQHLETELAIADKQLRLSQVKKQIAETELDIIGLQQTLQQQLEAVSQV